MESTNLGERMVRDKNEVTLPIPVRERLNLVPGDLIRFELNDGIICIHKVVTRKIGNNSKRVVDEEAAEEVVEGRPSGVV